jgi:hypothetical protein
MLVEFCKVIVGYIPNYLRYCLGTSGHEPIEYLTSATSHHERTTNLGRNWMHFKLRKRSYYYRPTVLAKRNPN